MNELALLLSSFDVSVLSDVIKSIADAVGMYISTVLLLVAIYIRLMETQVDALVSGGKYGTALRDMLLWSFVLGAYYSIGSYVIDFMNPIYAWLDSFGSLKATMANFSDLMEKNKIDLKADGVTFIGVLSTPYALLSMFFYYGTLVFFSFLTAFLKVANVMVFGVAFIWGLIAIPMSISTTFKILRGWAYLCAFALVWPVIQGLMMAMFAMLFATSTDTLMAVPDADATLRAANIMMLFSVMHLLLAAVMIASPFIANALVTNSSAAGGIVMPFVAAAAAVGVASVKRFRGATGAIGTSGLRSAGAGTSHIRTSPAARTVSARLAPMGADAPTPSKMSPATSSDAGGVNQSPDTARQKQRRRGVILRQQSKKKGL